MMDLHIRPKIQPYIEYGAHYFVTFGITPNIITLLSFLAGIFSAIAFIFGFNYLSLVFLWCSGIFDILDGAVARLTSTANPFGAYLDLISDRMVEAALIMSFAFVYPQNYYVYIFFLTALLLHFSAFLAAGALFKNNSQKSMHYDRSIVERAEAFFIFSFMIIAPAYQKPLLLALSIILFIAGISRIYRVWKYSQQFNYPN